VSSIKRCDIDRIYSEYVKITLKTTEAGTTKSQSGKNSIKVHDAESHEKTKRKYKKQNKDHVETPNSSVSLLKPANQSQNGKILQFKYVFLYCL
jgi:hypothetical protein